MNASQEDITKFLENPIKIITDRELDFEKAMALAKEKAREISDNPMLLSWYQGKTNEYSPKFACGKTNTPPWIQYAQARGGNLIIVVNNFEFVFIYLDLPSFRPRSRL